MIVISNRLAGSVALKSMFPEGGNSEGKGGYILGTVDGIKSPEHMNDFADYIRVRFPTLRVITRLNGGKK